MTCSSIVQSTARGTSNKSGSLAAASALVRQQELEVVLAKLLIETHAERVDTWADLEQEMKLAGAPL